MLTEKMRAFIAENNLIPAGARIGAAVSGGADSMAMLHLLKKLGYDVCVLHYEHGIRGEESEKDMRFVEEYCRRNGIAFYCERGSVPAEMTQGESTESAARRLRYDFFARMARELPLDLIATAHHADDAAETFFLHLLRGGGMTGLIGLRPKRDNIIRPLLFASRGEVEAYCAENDIGFVTDRTNLSTDHTRNYLRIDVLPRLAEVNPEYVGAIRRTRDLLRDEDAALEYYAERELEAAASFSEGSVRLSLEKFSPLPAGMRRRLLRMCIGHICPLTDVEKQHIDTLMELCMRGQTGTKFELPGKFSAIVSYNTLIIAEKMYKMKRMEEFSLRLSGDTELWQGQRLRCQAAAQAEFGEANDTLQYLNGDILQGAVIRTRRQGDRFHPLGADGAKKLKDWFIDKKIPAELRDSVPLVAVGGEVLWVIGYGISEKAKVLGNSSNIVQCKFEIY